MIEIHGKDIYRSRIKIGYVASNHIYNHEGKILGYFTSDSVYDSTGDKLAQIRGNYVYAEGKTIELDNIIQNVPCVGLSNSGRLAILIILGS